MIANASWSLLLVFGLVFGLSPVRAETVTLVVLADFKRDLIQNKGLSPERAQDIAQRLEARLARIFYQAGEQPGAAQSYRWRILTRPSLSQLGALMEAPRQKALIFLGHSAGGSADGQLSLPLWLGPKGENLTPFLSRLHPSIEHVSFVSCANQALLEYLRRDPDTREIWNRPWLFAHGFEPKVPPVDGLVQALAILNSRLTRAHHALGVAEPQPGVAFELSYPELQDEVWITFGNRLVAIVAPGQRGIKRFYVSLEQLKAATLTRRMLTLSVRFKNAQDSQVPLHLRWDANGQGAYPLKKLSAAQGPWLQIWTLFEGNRPWLGGSPQAWAALEPALKDRTQLYREYSAE